jgi:AcrR family transcriptional regulator
MPPKVRVTKERIAECAFELVRKNGIEALNARSIAQLLECSTQPIFSNFDSMAALQREVVKKAYEFTLVYREREISSGEFPSYKASGIAYIRFAKEEKMLFKLLFMSGADVSDCDIAKNDWNSTVESVARDAGVAENRAELFHLEMWIFVHGVASMFATGNIDLEMGVVSNMLTDVYLGWKERYGEV